MLSLHLNVFFIEFSLSKHFYDTSVLSKVGHPQPSGESSEKIPFDERFFLLILFFDKVDFTVLE